TRNRRPSYGDRAYNRTRSRRSWPSPRGVMRERPSREFVVSAEAAGLRYMTDSVPGIRRRRVGRGFSYVDPDGRVVRERERIHRFHSLGIPPAWNDVWICPNPDGHLQVTAR